MVTANRWKNLEATPCWSRPAGKKFSPFRHGGRFGVWFGNRWRNWPRDPSLAAGRARPDAKPTRPLSQALSGRVFGRQSEVVSERPVVDRAELPERAVCRNRIVRLRPAIPAQSRSGVNNGRHQPAVTFGTSCRGRSSRVGRAPICNFMTSPQAGAPTMPVPIVGSFLSSAPTLRV